MNNSNNNTRSNTGDIIVPPANINQSINTRVSIGPQHFDILKLIGQGAFGRVFLSKNLINNSIYAMKVISKKLLRTTNEK